MAHTNWCTSVCLWLVEFYLSVTALTRLHFPLRVASHSACVVLLVFLFCSVVDWLYFDTLLYTLIGVHFCDPGTIALAVLCRQQSATDMTAAARCHGVCCTVQGYFRFTLQCSCLHLCGKTLPSEWRSAVAAEWFGYFDKWLAKWLLGAAVGILRLGVGTCYCFALVHVTNVGLDCCLDYGFNKPTILSICSHIYAIRFVSLLFTMSVYVFLQYITLTVIVVVVCLCGHINLQIC